MASPTAAAKAAAKLNPVVASNRRARHDYEILSEFECGIVLAGSEVKSQRDGKAVLNDAYARIDNGEMWIYSLHIPPWQYSHGFGSVVDNTRQRKLLMHKSDIERLGHRVALERLQLIPLRVYFVNGRAKVEVALARGRNKGDKRQAMADRDSKREIDRALGRRNKGME